MSTEIDSAGPDRLYPFLSQMAALRQRARRHIENDRAAGSATGPATATIVLLLNEALASERICVARYQRRSDMSGSPPAETLRAEFQQHARDEQGHVEQLVARIVQLGGEPGAPPVPVSDLSELTDLDTDDLADMLEEDLIAERIAIESYREILGYIGSGDQATRELIEGILRGEVAHAEELSARRAEVLRRARVANGGTSVRLPVLELH